MSHVLERRTATILVTIAAAASVQRTSHSHVSLTRSLGLDDGRQHFVQLKAVAVRVSKGDESVKSIPFLKT